MTVLFAPLMGWLVHTFGWHSVFYVMGTLGISLSFAWLKYVHVAGMTTPIVIGFILEATGSFGEIRWFEFSKAVVRMAEAA